MLAVKLYAVCFKMRCWRNASVLSNISAFCFMQARSQSRCKCRCNAIFFWHRSIFLYTWASLALLWEGGCTGVQLGVFTQIRWCRLDQLPVWLKADPVYTCCIWLRLIHVESYISNIDSIRSRWRNHEPLLDEPPPLRFGLFSLFHSVFTIYEFLKKIWVKRDRT